MSIDFQVNLNQPLNFTAVILAHATLRLRYAAPQSCQSPDGSSKTQNALVSNTANNYCRLMNPCNSVSAALRLRLGLRPIKK